MWSCAPVPISVNYSFERREDELLFFSVLHRFLHCLSSENEEGGQKRNGNPDTYCPVARKTLLPLQIFSRIFFFFWPFHVECLRTFAKNWKEIFFFFFS